MKERFSDIVAWFGLSYFVVIAVADYMYWFPIKRLLIGVSYLNQEHWLIVLLVYIGCAIVNYLLVGRFRLLPWLKK